MMGLFGLGVPELAVIGAVAALAFGASSQSLLRHAYGYQLPCTVSHQVHVLQLDRVVYLPTDGACRAQQTAGARQGPWPDREELPGRSEGARHPPTFSRHTMQINMSSSCS